MIETSKERFKRFLEETQRKPYFSTLYDIDMWSEDKGKIEKYLEVLDILEKHPLLNLKLLYDYEYCNFEDYWEDYSGTTNELNEYEFKTLKQWQEKCLNTKK